MKKLSSLPDSAIICKVHGKRDKIAAFNLQTLLFSSIKNSFPKSKLSIRVHASFCRASVDL
jgi:hypothetical protein